MASFDRLQPVWLHVLKNYLGPEGLTPQMTNAYSKYFVKGYQTLVNLQHSNDDVEFYKAKLRQNSIDMRLGFYYHSHGIKDCAGERLFEKMKEYTDSVSECFTGVDKTFVKNNNGLLETMYVKALQYKARFVLVLITKVEGTTDACPRNNGMPKRWSFLGANVEILHVELKDGASVLGLFSHEYSKSNGWSTDVIQEFEKIPALHGIYMAWDSFADPQDANFYRMLDATDSCLACRKPLPPTSCTQT